MEKEKTRRLRFTYEDDVMLLREVISQNPIVDAEKWDSVAINLQSLIEKLFQVRTLKQHLQLLLETWMKKESVTTIKSGCEEPYSERDTLLQEVSNICSEFDGNVKKKRKIVSKEKQLSELGKAAREKMALSLYPIENEGMNKENEEIVVIFEENDSQQKAEEDPEPRNPDKEREKKNNVPGTSEQNDGRCFANEVSNDSEIAPSNLPKRNILTPTRRRQTRSLKKDSLQYLSGKNEADNKIKMRQMEIQERKVANESKRLALEERKISLEERKFELDRQERNQKVMIEKEKARIDLEERQTLRNLLNSQQKIIETLLQKNEN